MLYNLLKRLVGVFFNTLNLLLAGNLPPLGTVCVIVEEHGHYLVIKHPTGGVVPPGGFIRWRENPSQAAQREAEEETGLRVELRAIIGCYSMINSRFDYMNALTLVYHGEVIGGKLRSSIEGQPCWIHEAELRSRLKSAYKPMLDDYFHYRTQRTTLEVPSP